MLLFDVNVGVQAMRRDLPDHEACSAWLTEAASGPEHLGVSTLVLQAIMRIVTNHRVFKEPSSTAEALTFAQSILAAPSSVPVIPGQHHWRIFSELAAEHSLTGNALPDAYFAALALENRATWATLDKDFRKFKDLRLLDPRS